MTQNHSPRAAQKRLAQVKAPWLSGTLGLAVILAAFVGSVINASLESPNSFISTTLQPFIFVGMGLLLFHIGSHVHAVHQNVLMMVAETGESGHDDGGRGARNPPVPSAPDTRPTVQRDDPVATRESDEPDG